ncbi:MAG: hypothetical protein ABSE22_14700 [Xanthobacteraceae bacterium]|jgi:hypothetical protein
MDNPQRLAENFVELFTAPPKVGPGIGEPYYQPLGHQAIVDFLTDLHGQLVVQKEAHRRASDATLKKIQRERVQVEAHLKLFESINEIERQKTEAAALLARARETVTQTEAKRENVTNAIKAAGWSSGSAKLPSLRQ